MALSGGPVKLSRGRKVLLVLLVLVVTGSVIIYLNEKHGRREPLVIEGKTIYPTYTTFDVAFREKMISENENLKLKEFSFVDDSGNFHRNVDLTDKVISKNADCTFGCGIFEFEKKSENHGIV